MKLHVQLGRIGDILNILPLCNGSRLMVAKEFAPLLEGVSYVEPVIYDGPHYEIAKAMEFAKSVSKDVVCSQVNGPLPQVLEHVYKPAGRVGAIKTSYQKESWGVAGRIDEWDSLLPLVFDRRNEEREEKLLRDNGFMSKKQKPVILLSLKSHSSPFPFAAPLEVESSPSGIVRAVFLHEM